MLRLPRQTFDWIARNDTSSHHILRVTNRMIPPFDFHDQYEIQRDFDDSIYRLPL